MEEESPKIKMGKVVVSKTSCILSLVVFLLMCACVALLVFILKGEQYSERLEFENHQVPPDFQADEPPTEPPQEMDPWKHYRLPSYIVPMHYDLLFLPNLTTSLFTGTANITVNVVQKTKYFIVHEKDLDIVKSKLFDVKGDSEIEVEKSFKYTENEYFVVETNRTVDPGVYKLHFEFRGFLNGPPGDHQIVGYYKSTYKIGNETRHLATTKFEPTYARRAFPCFDEPNLKSTFSIALVHEHNYTAISNMPVETTKPYEEGNLLVTKFQKSVLMPTYLACFIVCDFHYQETMTSKGKPFRVYSSPGLLNTTSFALQIGPDILNFLEEYFGIDYSLPKQDMIAIPDFISTAMENWGLITFREEALLYDPENSTPSQQQKIATVIAHEMAHIWYGNLVTMKWWNDLWLNEGFASYIEYKGVDATHPDWDILSQFLTEDLQPMLITDHCKYTNPIVKKIYEEAFQRRRYLDNTVYKKGASVLRMLEFIMGPENFRFGISKYLKKYKYQNTETANLWEELSDLAGDLGGRNISSIMKLWTEQSGFPCISVTRKGQNSSTFTFKQKTFLSDSTFEDDCEKNIWSVPISYMTSDGESGIYWLHDEEGELVLPIDDSKWVKFNINQTGYYIVNYEEGEWKRLADVLLTNPEELSPTDRSNLLFDSYQLAEAGILDITIFLSITKYMRNETHIVPWKTANIVFENILKFERDDVDFMFKGYIRDLTNEVYGSLKWEVSDNHLDNLLRPVIIDLACQAENKVCLSDAADLYQDWISGQSVHPAVRSKMFKFGLANQGLEEWENSWEMYLSEQSPSKKRDYLIALSSIRKPHIIQKFLEYSMDEEKISPRDFSNTVRQIARNPVGKTLAINFFHDKVFPSGEDRRRNSVYSYHELGKYLSTESELKKFKVFSDLYPSEGDTNYVISIIKKNIRWVEKYTNSLKAWLINEGPAVWNHYRLPSHIIPQHYDLTLFPMLDQDIFNGTVSISVILQKPSDCFVLHALGLEISKIEVVDQKMAKLVELDEVFPYMEYDYLVVKVKEKLPIGSYKLYFEFEGPFTVSLRGLYKSSYLDPVKNEKRYLATTQFEAIDARRAFPCFDEPRFKASFKVSVIHDSSHYVLSNTLVENTTDLENDLSLTVFEETPPMVTYLLSIDVCDFKFKETFTESGVRIRVYAAPYHYENIDYSLQLGRRILTFYEDYFGIAFPLKKLDMIAVPDFNANGMENWGLVSFSERSLVTKIPLSITARKHMSAIMAHELAHMWFGDLVSLAWWDDLWLNEGFATYMSQKGVQNVEPNFDEENFEGISRLLIAMKNDQTVNAHAIVPTVTKVTSELFDAITYSKGATILRMLENYMGEDFRDGVSDYLKNYAFDYAKTEHLWEKLSENSRKGLNVSVLMSTWTTQPNYPYVSVRRDRQHDDYYIIQQHHFLRALEPNDLIYSVSPERYVWQIPVSYFSSHNNKVSYILLNSTEEVRLHIPDSKWIKFNAGLEGYYSVNYEEEIWEELISLLQTNSSALSPSDRINLVFDAFSLASAGLLRYDVPLNLTRYVKTETYHGAWSVVLQELLKIKRSFRKIPGEIQDIIQEYIRTLSTDLYQDLSWNDTGSYAERTLRNILIETVCESGGKHCLQMAFHLFKEWMNGQDLEIDIREVVYTYGLQADENEESWNYVWDKYLQENDLYERERLRNALTKVQNANFIERLINYSWNETIVRKHEYFTVLQQIAMNSEVGFNLVSRRIFTEWEDLLEMHGDIRSIKFSSEIFSLFTTEEELKEVEEFYEKNDKSNIAVRARTRAIDSIVLNINWLKKHNDTIQKWFQSTVYMPWKYPRLPNHVLPLKYTLNLHPNLTIEGPATIEGEVIIELNITRPTDNIVLHAKSLKIEETELTKSGSQVVLTEEFFFQKNEFFVILLKESVQPGIFDLRIKYHGSFSSKGEGIGLFEYITKETLEIRYLAATRFEGTYARNAFPCFDEPDKKAKFQMNVKHDEIYDAVSNMPVQGYETLENGLAKTVFEESVPMSTYLLFLLISDFGYLEEYYNGKPIRVYAPKDQLDNAKHGLNFTVKILMELEDYFNIPYTLSKLDSVVIPNYPVLGMEHWGVITYSSERFLITESMTQHKRIVEIERVIVHEIIHQWIGNLVTPEWWDDLWVTEGIPHFLQYFTLKRFYPSINQIDVVEKARNMCIDSKTDSHPLVRNITTSREINESFDYITYEKGAAVIQMLQFILKDDFRTGLTNFLEKYSFKTAKTENLLNEMSNSTEKNVDVSGMMNTWLHQMGFPYIEIKRNSGEVAVTQQWFLRNTNTSKIDEEVIKHPSPFGYTWEVPLTFKNLDSGEDDTLWLKTKQEVFRINASKQDVVKFNTDFTGFYVVNYDPIDWAKLGQRLLQNHEDFSAADRYNILHDAFILAESGRLSYEIPLQLTKYLPRERESSIWNFYREQYLYIMRRLDPESEARNLFKEYTKKLTAELYDDYVHALPTKKYFLKWHSLPSKCTFINTEPDFISVIIDLACQSSHMKCVNSMEQDLQESLRGEMISSDIRFVLDIAIPHFGNESLWNLMYLMMRESNDSQYAEIYLEGLTKFRDPSLIQKTLEILIDPSLSKYLTLSMLYELSKNPVAFPHLWDSARQNLKIVFDRLNDDSYGQETLTLFCENLKRNNWSQMDFLFRSFQTLREKCWMKMDSKRKWNENFEKTITPWLLWNTNS